MRCLLTLLLCCIGISPPALCAAASWQLDYQQSKIAFFAVQEGRPIKGGFGRFLADINFHPQQLGDSHFQVLIDTDSVDTGASERDDILRSDEFFDIRRWPQAEFKTIAISHLEGIHYEASALLKIRDIEKAVLFPFSLNIRRQDSQTTLFGHGELSINRFDFDMAQGDWADTSLIGESIKIQVTIQAKRKSKKGELNEQLE